MLDLNYVFDGDVLSLNSSSIETHNYYDFPRIFTITKPASDKYLVAWVDEDEDHDYWMVGRYEEENIEYFVNQWSYSSIFQKALAQDNFAFIKTYHKDSKITPLVFEGLISDFIN